MLAKILLNINQDEFSDLEKGLLSFINSNKEVVVKMSIGELSEATYVSKSTIVRLMKKLGFSGFSEFKFSLNQDIKQKKMNNKTTFDLFKSQSADIQNTLRNIDIDKMKEASVLIKNSQITYCYGTGYSQRKAMEEFGKQLIACGKKVILIPNETELEIMTNIMTPQDVLMISSLSGETKDIKETILDLNIRNIDIVSFTQNQNGSNFISQHSNYAFFYNLTKFEVVDNKNTLSFITLHLVLDYLLRVYVTETRSINNDGDKKTH